MFISILNYLCLCQHWHLAQLAVLSSWDLPHVLTNYIPQALNGVELPVTVELKCQWRIRFVQKSVMMYLLLQSCRTHKVLLLPNVTTQGHRGQFHKAFTALCVLFGFLASKKRFIISWAWVQAKLSYFWEWLSLQMQVVTLHNSIYLSSSASFCLISGLPVHFLC